MGTFIPNTSGEQQKMLESCGFQNFDDMYSCIPQALRLHRALNIPEGRTGLEVRRKMTDLAEKNHIYRTMFRGAGAYRHFIPSIVREVTDKEERSLKSFVIDYNRSHKNNIDWDMPDSKIKQVYIHFTK